MSLEAFEAIDDDQSPVQVATPAAPATRNHLPHTPIINLLVIPATFPTTSEAVGTTCRFDTQMKDGLYTMARGAAH